MPASVSLRRSLRKVPEFRLLSGKDLDAIIARMTIKEYRSGEVLWRTGTQLDFWGIIESGEIVVERKINGTVIRSVRLTAGEVVRPRNSKGGTGHSSVLARAVTDVKIGILRLDRADDPNMKRARKTAGRLRNILWRVAWAVITLVLLLAAGWRDMSRVLAGLFYLETTQTGQSASDTQRFMTLLDYAESLDQSAAFAHNQEGFLLYQTGDLQNAEASFSRTVDIDQTNGPGLNNLAVAYFETGDVQQAVSQQKQAARNDANSAVVHYNLGLILMEQGNYKESAREFREASFINPDWALPYMQLGLNYLQAQDYVNAEKVASTAIKLDADQQSAYVILAVSLYNQGRFQEALIPLHSALQLDPANRIAMFYKGLVLNRLGEFDPALTILEQLLETTSDPGQAARISAEMEAIHRALQNQNTDVP